MTKARIRQLRSAAGENENLTECLDEIERLQSFTRRGTEPEDLPRAAKVKAKAKSGKAEPDPRVKQLIDGFFDAYKEFHKTPYVVTPGKDSSAAKRLVGLFPVDDILDTAWEAWKHPDKWACRQALTIAGLASKINEVKVDIKLCANGGRPPRTEPPGVTL